MAGDSKFSLELGREDWLKDLNRFSISAHREATQHCRSGLKKKTKRLMFMHVCGSRELCYMTLCVTNMEA